MTTSNAVQNNTRAASIAAALGVTEFSPLMLKQRIVWIETKLRDSGCTSLVLGISGGVDSMVAGALCQLAVDNLNESLGKDTYSFIAMRLPYGTQADESDAMLAIQDIAPTRVEKVNIKGSVDAMMAELGDSLSDKTPAEADFVKGNIKARARMIAQYAVANANNGLVVGTDHAAEAVMGFFTKFGDGACDIAPLSGLTKRQVRTLGQLLGLPESIINKTPTADLEDLDPGKPDEMAYGLTYDNIDDYLEGKPVPELISVAIEARYDATGHKRDLPYTP